MPENRKLECKYGYFSNDGMEYVITRPDTPKPWINVISNGHYGTVVSQTGSGFSWLENSNLKRVTRYFQDLVEDSMGKYVYIKDDESGRFWSAGWKPVCEKPDFYECRYGIGYSRITSAYSDIKSEMTVFVSPDEPVEIWMLKLRNESGTARKLSLFSYLEWNLGVYNLENREFQKIFIDNAFDEELKSFVTTKRLWEVANGKRQNLNSDWNHVAFHSSSMDPVSYDGDRESFIGLYGSKSKPEAVVSGLMGRNTGKWIDSIASLKITAELQPGETKDVVFILGVTETMGEAEKIIRKYKSYDEADKALQGVRGFWDKYLNSAFVETPDDALNVMTNIWLKYQTISCRLWSRTAYYQSGGAYGFRDQLQDSQLFLTFMPEMTKRQIILHSRHQFNDGTVKHWWQPTTEEGPDSNFSDDLLWLPFVVGNYLTETGDFSILDAVEPFLDGGSGTVYEHCKRAMECSYRRLSPRGIPLIGEGDWNDGLSACGTDWIGESFWVGEFLVCLINIFAQAIDFQKDIVFHEKCLSMAASLKRDINLHGWDGKWYVQSTTDNGKVIGSDLCSEGKIFLNPQIWAILSDIVPEERLGMVIESIRKYLLKDYGALLLSPAYSAVDGDIGYLTRYAPGLRENGGVYSHAATWAVMAFCKLKMPEVAYDIYRKICPANRSFDIDVFRTEPYVMPGNTDGPDSPNYGRGGWTWYTGSAAWLFRVANEHILGIRPERNGLIVDPCIPAEWDGFKVRRVFRGAAYEISVKNPQHVSFGLKAILHDGKPVKGNLLPACPAGSINRIEAVLGLT